MPDRAVNDAAEGPDRYVDPVIEAYKKDVDVTLIRAFLKMTPEERILSLQNSLRDIIELQHAARRAMEQRNR
jgi:hypothetical protein